MANASLDPIITRISGVDPYHPGEANTFYDWSMEAGDIVTIKRNEEEYEIPVHSAKAIWKGGVQVAINSPGNKERESIANASKRKYGRGSGAMRNENYIYKEFTSSDGMLYSAIYMSESKLQTVFSDAIESVNSTIIQTANMIYTAVYSGDSALYSYTLETATQIYSHVGDVENGLHSEINQTASQIYSSVYAADSNLYSYINQTSTQIYSHVGNVASGLHSEINQTAEQIYSSVWAADSMVYSYVNETSTQIYSHVGNVESGLHSEIDQTAERIQAAVYAADSTIYSFIALTATNIRSVVADLDKDLHSEIEQTQSMIRSSVWTANSTVFSYIEEKAEYILEHVGERSGAKVHIGETEPVDSPDNPISPGDMWLDGNYINFWDDADFKFVNYDPDEPEYDWTQLRGAKLKVWKDGEWKLVEDGTTLAEDTDIRMTKDQINLVAHNLGKFDGELRSNIARLDVKADKISSTVNERIADVGSRITQTAYEIRSEVHSASSQIYSAIEQTATSIRSYVVDEINDVGSEILQTASQIRTEVHAANSSLYSYINQTASSIRMSVASTASGLQSQITVNAGNINLKVSKNNVISEINQTSEAITINAAKINLNGYVKATDITTSYLTTKLEDASLVKAGGFQSTGTIYASGAITSGSDVKVTIGSSNVSLLNAYNALQVVSAGNNTYKIQRKSFNNSEWQDVPGTFSRAVASWSVGWSSGKWTITANPQSQSAWVSIYQGNASWSGRTVSIPIKSVSSEQGTEVTAYTARATLSASNITLTRSAPQVNEPSTTNTVTKISTNGWYIMYVRVNGDEKQYKIKIEV